MATCKGVEPEEDGRSYRWGWDMEKGWSQGRVTLGRLTEGAVPDESLGSVATG